MSNEPLNRILLAAIILLALGEGYLLYQNAQLRAVAPQAGAANPASAAPLAQAPTTVLIPLGGTIASIMGGTLTLSTGASTTIAIDASSYTAIVKEDAPKDATTYQADLEKFHDESDRLMQDPQKNQYALAHLVAPSPYQTTTLSLPDLKVGDVVTIFGEPQSDGTFAATQIIVAQPVSK
jgi:hypothetical protein